MSVRRAFNLSSEEKKQQDELHYQSIKKLIKAGQIEPLLKYIKSHKPVLNFDVCMHMAVSYTHLTLPTTPYV